MVTNSILDSTKKILGIDADYKAFDLDIQTHINSVFFTLNDLGIGPEEGYEITGSSDTWTEYLGADKNLNAIKTYVYLRVRLLFDPPETSYAREAMRKQYEELEWRLNVYRERRDKPYDHGTDDDGA